MSYYENALKLKSNINTAAKNLTDEVALSVIDLYPSWETNFQYNMGDRIQYDCNLYKCLTSHTSQDTWTPTDAPSLWTKVLIPDPDVIPGWEQPDSTNPYGNGDKVTHNGKTWVSNVDGNVWEPGVYGWTEV